MNKLIPYLLTALAALALVILFWRYQNRAFSKEEISLVNELINNNKGSLFAKEKDIIQTVLNLRSKVELGGSRAADRRVLEDAEGLYHQSRSFKLLADSAFAFMQQQINADNKASVTNTQLSRLLVKLDSAYYQSLKVLNLHLYTDINPQEEQVQAGVSFLYSSQPKPELVMLRIGEMQAHLMQLESEAILILAQRIGANVIKCWFGLPLAYTLKNTFLQGDQEGEVYFSMNEIWRSDAPFKFIKEVKGFYVNGQEVKFFNDPVSYRGNDYDRLIRSYNPEGYHAQVIIPTSLSDLGTADSVTKTWEGKWVLPVSYSRDSAITIQGKYTIWRDCKGR